MKEMQLLDDVDMMRKGFISISRTMTFLGVLMVAQFSCAQFVSPLQMQMESLQSSIRASQTRLEMLEMDDDERAAEYKIWKLKVKSCLGRNDLMGAARVWEEKCQGMWKYRDEIGEDCEEWMTEMKEFWGKVQEAQCRQVMLQQVILNQQINNAANSGKSSVSSMRGGTIPELKCGRCGTTYCGQFSCPNCSAPKYDGSPTKYITIESGGKTYKASY